MQAVKFRLRDGSTSEVIKGVNLLEVEDLYPTFNCDLKLDPNFTSQQVKARSFASMQLRAKNAMRRLLVHSNEQVLVLSCPSSVNAIECANQLLIDLGYQEPIIAYAPSKSELFGDKEKNISGLLNNPAPGHNAYNIIIMPIVHLNDHPKWLALLDEALYKHSQVKLILCGDANDVASLSMMWPYLDNAIRSDIVLEFVAYNAIETLAALISHYQQLDSQILSFNYDALELLARYACRLSGDRRYIGVPEIKLKALIYEAVAFARRSNATLVNVRAVLKALGAYDFRNNYLAEASLRDHRDKQLLVATQGAVVGQINGLSVIETLGTAYEYGEPVRISATVRAGGEGDVIDIERKAELAGQIHAKAMMIINGFLTKEFGEEQPLPVSASLVFEQSYSEVDGDSASLTGLCAVISALANVPIRQDLAVTGAVDQFGDVQAVGGVNEKIEGFFRVCRLHGFTNTQGVIIPSACVHQLVLKPAIIKAVAEGKFHIFTVSHVVEAVKLLTTIDWGDIESEGSICARIAERLNNIIAGNNEPTWYENAIDKVKTLLHINKE